jgi:hypothetical protein
MTEVLRPSDFRELSGPLLVDVTIDGAARRLELAVRSVAPLPAHRLRAEPFAMILAGPAEPCLPQATYRVEHPVLGALDLFIVPIARKASGVEYEVTFN